MSDLALFFHSVKLPVMSEVAHSLIRTLNDEDVSVTQVRNIIAKDPSLTARLLRLANSASFGLSRKIGSLDEAVALIGMSQVRALALSAGLNTAFPVVAGLDRKAFWDSCMACAGYSQWLAGSLGMDRQQAWLSGLMLRLGELLIGQVNPERIAQIEALPQVPGERWERELKLLGFTEGEMTGELARHWKFPDEMVRGLETCAKPMLAKPFSPLGGVIHLSALLADMPGCGPEAVEKLPIDVMGKLQLNVDWMQGRFPSPDTFLDISTS
jgi:HD-like signal output (HDOD) protein